MYDLYMFETIEQLEQETENVYEVVLVDNISQKELLALKEIQVVVLYDTEENLYSWFLCYDDLSWVRFEENED